MSGDFNVYMYIWGLLESGNFLVSSIFWTDINRIMNYEVFVEFKWYCRIIFIRLLDMNNAWMNIKGLCFCEDFIMLNMVCQIFFSHSKKEKQWTRLYLVWYCLQCIHFQSNKSCCINLLYVKHCFLLSISNSIDLL